MTTTIDSISGSIGQQVAEEVLDSLEHPLEEALLPAFPVLVLILKVVVLDGFQRVQLDYLEDFPLLHLEILSTSAREISLVELVQVGMLEVAREIAGGIGEFVGLVPDKQVISSSESWTIAFEATDGLVLEGFH